MAKQGILKGAAGKAHRLNVVPLAENFGKTNGCQGNCVVELGRNSGGTNAGGCFT